MLNLDFDTSAELLCFATSVFCLSKDKNLVWRSFRIYLFITCLTELTALYLTNHHRQNAWLYNISILFEMGFTSRMFAELLNEYINGKKLIKSGYILFVVIYIVETISHIYKKGITGVLHFNDLTNEVMSVLFVFYALYYFYLLLKDDGYVDLKVSARFWWVMGVLLFYFGSTAINLYRGIDVTIQKPVVQNVKTAYFNKAHEDRSNSKISKTSVANKNKVLSNKKDSLQRENKVSAAKPKKVKSKKETLTEFILGVFIAMLNACWIYSFICRRWLATT